MNKPTTTATVKCPTCKGSGSKIRAWDWSLMGGKKGKRKQTCLSCRGAGKVEASRVCSKCGNWLDLCRCGDRHRIVSIVQRPVQTPPPVPEVVDVPVPAAPEPEPVATIVEAQDPVPELTVKARRPKRSSAPKKTVSAPCLYGFSVCDLQAAFCGGLLCQRCGYFLEGARHE